MRSMKSSSGFTLIELMIVVVIIGILAAIAIPRFQARNNNTGNTGNDAALTQAASAQQQYKQQHNTYASNTAELASVGWDSTSAGSGQSLRVVSASADNYCIESSGGGGANASTQARHVTQDGKVQAGSCQP